MTLPLEPPPSTAPASREEGAAPALGEVPITESTAETIAFILARYHAVHRQELPGLIELARKVESIHAGHPEVPAGIADFLEEIAGRLEQHMQKEELVLFPLIQGGGHPAIGHPIAELLADHDEHTDHVATLAALTHGLKLPEDSCGSWRALYAGLAKFSEDMIEHIQMENGILFQSSSMEGKCENPG